MEREVGELGHIFRAWMDGLHDEPEGDSENQLDLFGDKNDEHDETKKNKRVQTVRESEAGRKRLEQGQ